MTNPFGAYLHLTCEVSGHLGFLGATITELEELQASAIAFPEAERSLLRALKDQYEKLELARLAARATAFGEERAA